MSQRTIGSVDSDQETRKPGLKDGLDQESSIFHIFHILNESSFGFVSLLTQYRHNTSEANNKQLVYNLTFPSSLKIKSLTIGPATILFSQDYQISRYLASNCWTVAAAVLDCSDEETFPPSLIFLLHNLLICFLNDGYCLFLFSIWK